MDRGNLEEIMDKKLEEHKQQMKVIEQKLKAIAPYFKKMYEDMINGLKEAVENTLLSAEDIFQTLKDNIDFVEYNKKYQEINVFRREKIKEFEEFKSFLESQKQPETYIKELSVSLTNLQNIAMKSAEYLQEAIQEVEKVKAIGKVYKEKETI